MVLLLFVIAGACPTVTVVTEDMSNVSPVPPPQLPVLLSEPAVNPHVYEPPELGVVALTDSVKLSLVFNLSLEVLAVKQAVPPLIAFAVQCLLPETEEIVYVGLPKLVKPEGTVILMLPIFTPTGFVVFFAVIVNSVLWLGVRAVVGETTASQVPVTAALYGPTNGPRPHTGGEPAGCIEFVAVLAIARARLTRPFPV